METKEVVVAFYSGKAEGVTTRKLDTCALLSTAVSRESMYYKRMRQTIKADGLSLLVDKREYGKQAVLGIARALSFINAPKRVILLGYGLMPAEQKQLAELAATLQHHANVETEVCLKAT